MLTRTMVGPRRTVQVARVAVVISGLCDGRQVAMLGAVRTDSNDFVQVSVDVEAKVEKRADT